MSTLVLLMLGIIIFSVVKLAKNNTQKSSMADQTVNSKELRENFKGITMKKPVYSTLKSQVNDTTCLKKAEELFQVITKKIRLPPAYDMLYERVRQLQCNFVSTST